MEVITSSNSWAEFENKLLKLGPDEEFRKEKGDAFEELTRLYLLTDPTFSTKIKNVWNHSKIPQKIIDCLQLSRPEIGVDLVAELKNGDYYAIQCKFHQDRSKNVTLNELSSFFGITGRKNTYEKLSHRIVCTSANGVSLSVGKSYPEKLGFLTSDNFAKLGKEDFDAFRKLLQGGHHKPEPFTPRPHQELALKKCVEYFEDRENTRGKIIHPCASGKSLTGYWISRRVKAKTVLLAVPSLALVRQTLGSWTREAVATGVDMDWIAVCSDDDVKNTDDPSVHAVDLGIEVNTDPKAISAFLSKPAEGTKVIITTYQSGLAVSEGVREAGVTFDLGVYDEAHKTVGQKDKKFSHLLFDENIKVKKRVFMTATERQFKGNSDEYLSMDDEDIYGSMIHQLSFKAALEQKPPILSDYKIVSTIVTKAEIQKLIDDNEFVKTDGSGWTVEGGASTLASLIVLRGLIEQYGLKHAVSFHSSIKRSKEFQHLNAEVNKADGEFSSLSSFHVSGKDSTGARAAELERFVEAEPSLITNARCLTEGVDLPAIDAVLFADPKQSKIDIVQAAGRALRKFEGKKYGYIIVPVVLDEEVDEPSDEAFKQIITVISALGIHDERIIEEFKAIANERSPGRRRIVDINVPEIIRVKFKDFISNVKFQIWDRLSFGWVKGFDQLKKYAKKEGHARVPFKFKDEDGFSLGTWVSSRRTEYNKGNLSDDHIAQLEAVDGWVWDAAEEDFKIALQKLKKYVKTEGHARVPFKFKDDDGFSLGTWVGRQRIEYNKDNLSDDRIAQLEDVDGWAWDAAEEYFKIGLQKLKKYVKTKGHARVPGSYKDDDGFSLGSWVNSRRIEYNKGNLSDDRIAQLEAVDGWVWAVKKK